MQAFKLVQSCSLPRRGIVPEICQRIQHLSGQRSGEPVATAVEERQLRREGQRRGERTADVVAAERQRLQRYTSN